MTRKSFLFLFVLFAALFSFFEITGQYTAGGIILFIMLTDILGAFVVALVKPVFAWYFFSPITSWSATL